MLFLCGVQLLIVTYLNSILVLQIRSIRDISKSPYLPHTDVMCAKYGFVKIDRLWKVN